MNLGYKSMDGFLNIKRVMPVIAAGILLIIVMTYCIQIKNSKNGLGSQTDISVESTDEAVTEEREALVVVSSLADELGFRLHLPDGWSAEEITETEIKFWKNDNPEYTYRFLASDMWTICGTGVTVERFTREDGSLISFYYEKIWYDNDNHINEVPDYIYADYVFENVPGSYVIEYMGDYDIFMEQMDEMMDILDKCEVGIMENGNR